MAERFPPGPPPRALGLPPAQPDLPPPPHGSPVRPVSGGFVAGVVLVSIWMALSLLFSLFLIPFGGDAVCNAARDSEACFDRFNVQWLVLMGVELAAAVAAVVLLAIRRTRVWGIVLGVLGTGGVALAFSFLVGIDL
jgi:hypothetical protein